MARMKFLCDADRCIECNACVTACKNEHEVPWGINRRRVVTINDGLPGERSVSMACMHCTDAPCAAVCPVDCFYTTDDAVVLHSKDTCIGCGYCFYACPFGAPQYPKVGNFGTRGKMDKCTYCAGGPEADMTRGRVHQVRLEPSGRGQAAALCRDVLDQVAAGWRRRYHRGDLQGTRRDPWLRLGRLGLAHSLRRHRHRVSGRKRDDDYENSRNTIGRRLGLVLRSGLSDGAGGAGPAGQPDRRNRSPKTRCSRRLQADQMVAGRVSIPDARFVGPDQAGQQGLGGDPYAARVRMLSICGRGRCGRRACCCST